MTVDVESFRFRHHIPFIIERVPFIILLSDSSSLTINISVLVNVIMIPQSNSFPRDINVLLSMSENRWHALSCRGSSLYFKMHMCVEVMSAPLGKTTVAASFTVALTFSTSAFALAQ